MKAPGEERFVQRRAEQRSGATVFGPRRCEPAHCKAWRLCWAKSRKDRNQQHRSLHGNLQVVVANVTALSNLRLALASKPDVALLCEVRASRSQLLAEAKKFGYTAAVGGDGFALLRCCSCRARVRAYPCTARASGPTARPQRSSTLATGTHAAWPWCMATTGPPFRRSRNSVECWSTSCLSCVRLAEGPV